MAEPTGRHFGARAARRDRARVQRDIEIRLRARQFLSRVFRVELLREDPNLRLTHSLDQAAFDNLTQSTFGRIVLITDREEWSTAEIIAAYRAQAYIERLFRRLKNPAHVALRPRHHWTEQKVMSTFSPA